MSSRQPPDNPKHLLKRRTHGKSHIQHLVFYTLHLIKNPEQGPKITDLLCSGFTSKVGFPRTCVGNETRWDHLRPIYMFLVTTVVTRIFSNDSLLFWLRTHSFQISRLRQRKERPRRRRIKGAIEECFELS